MSSYNNFDVENFLKEFNVNAYRASGGSWEQLAKILEVAETLATNKSNETTNKEKTVSSTYVTKDAPQATYNGAAATNSNNRKTEPAHMGYNHEVNELNKSIEHLNKRVEDYTKAVKALKVSKADGNNFIEHMFSLNNNAAESANPALRKNVTINNSNGTENNDKTVYSYADSTSTQNTISSLNNNKATTSTDSESYELYSNEGIRMFLYNIRKRFPETLRFINSICEDSSAYHDLIFNVLTDEILDGLVDVVEKSAIAYNKLIENHGVEIVRKIISRPSDFSFLFS